MGLLAFISIWSVQAPAESLGGGTRTSYRAPAPRTTSARSCSRRDLLKEFVQHKNDLMLIGLFCSRSYGNQMMRDYGHFTTRHRSIVIATQNTLGDLYITESANTRERVIRNQNCSQQLLSRFNEQIRWSAQKTESYLQQACSGNAPAPQMVAQRSSDSRSTSAPQATSRRQSAPPRARVQNASYSPAANATTSASVPAVPSRRQASTCQTNQRAEIFAYLKSRLLMTAVSCREQSQQSLTGLYGDFLNRFADHTKPLKEAISGTRMTEINNTLASRMGREGCQQNQLQQFLQIVKMENEQALDQLIDRACSNTYR